MPTLFISDLHLEPGRPDINTAFLALLEGEARHADALYILGDLFEAWIGDDVTLPDHPQVIAALRALSDHGVPIYIQTGNRDFMIGKLFCKATGATLLADEHIIELGNEATLLMHGDQLCTDDLDYMRWRKIYKNRIYQALFALFPRFLRRKIGRSLRENLRGDRYDKPKEITDANQQSIEESMRWHGVKRLIHGHTHRPAVHDFELDGAAARRIVLGDWYSQGSVLRWDDDGGDLQQLPFAAK